MSRMRAPSDRVGRTLGWTDLNHPPPTKARPGSPFREPTIGSASSARPRVLRTPLPIRPRSLRFYLTPIKCTCTPHFGNFSTLCGNRLTNLHRILLPVCSSHLLLFGDRTPNYLWVASSRSVLASSLIKTHGSLASSTLSSTFPPTPTNGGSACLGCLRALELGLLSCI